MRDFILAVLAGVIATAVYKTYADKQGSTTSTSSNLGADGTNPVIGSTTMTRLPVFSSTAAEAGHGDAVLNANPAIPYTPAFGAKTNQAASCGPIVTAGTVIATSPGRPQFA